MSDDLTDVIIKDELCSQCGSPSLVWRHCMNVTCPNNKDDHRKQPVYTAADLQREKLALLDEVRRYISMNANRFSIKMLEKHIEDEKQRIQSGLE